MSRTRVAAMLAACLALEAPAAAHHSFSASYDADQPIVLTGAIARVDLVNPHAWLYVDVKEAGGGVVRWNVEMDAPNNLDRRGVTKATFAIGGIVTVDGYRARDGSHTVSG